jgi:PAT family beta-lactamase induction signal transducer AmpG
LNASPALVLSRSRPLRLGTFFYLYVMQGLPPGFSLTALANYLAAEGQSPATIGTFVAAVGLPWTAQFVWGPLIDRYQTSPMGRRRPWVLGTQLLAFGASLGLLLVRDPVAELGLLTAAFFVHSVAASVQDAAVDAMAISVIPESERGRVNAFMRGGMLVGSGLGAILFATLLRQYDFRTAAAALSALLLALTVLTFFIRERPHDALLPGPRRRVPPAAEEAPPRHSFRWLFGELARGFFAPRSFRIFGAIVLVYLSCSLFIRAFPVHLIQVLGWTDAEVSVLTGTSGTLLPLGVILAGGVAADRFGARRLLGLVMLGIAGYLLLFNGLSGTWSNRAVGQTGLALWYLVDPLFSVAAMPVLMSLCRRGVEGSQFTTYMALVNFSDVLGSFGAGYLQTALSAPTIGLLAGGLVLIAAGLSHRAFRAQSAGS